MELKVTIEGKTGLLAALLQVQRGVVDLRQLGTWDWVQSTFYKIEKEQFGSEGAAGKGGKWRSLSPKYAVAKQRKYGDKPILQATGSMYRDLTTSAGYVEKKEQEMTIGTTRPYAGYHQNGTSKMPKRPPVDMTAAQEKELTEPIVKKLRQLVANARLRDVRGF